MSKKTFDLKFRVWHIPQVPGKPFHVEVRDYAEAIRVKATLADYDTFQFENKIKPDYCNASGIQVYQHDLADEEMRDMELEDRWVDVGDVDELNDYLDHLRSTGWSISPDQTVVSPITPSKGRLDAIASLFKEGFCDDRMVYDIYAAALGVDSQWGK